MRITYPLAILALASLLFAGCQTLQTPDWAKSWLPESKPKLVESKYSRPARIAVLWSPAMLNNPGNKPTRGFGGRIYFYDAKDTAVPVEGQLVVYAYNNSSPHSDGKTPDRKYAFTPEQFTQHFSPTELGASYSVWIPWDEVGNAQQEISLVPIFTASNGQLIVGQPSKTLLPGPTTENAPIQYDRRTVSVAEMVPRPYPGSNGVQQASYLVPPTPGVVQPPRNPQELTLKLPTSMMQQLANADPVALPKPNDTATMLTALNNSPHATASSPGAVAPPWSPSNQPSARYVRPTPPAPSSPGPPPVAGRLPSRPSPGGLPAGPPSSLPQAPQTGFPAAW